jgi:myo-inositol 2-dehydrogenase/D-chiro-inositol 1-dehydrogenase
VSTRVGIIGTGVMGADHASILQRYVSGGEIELLADLDLDRARSVAEPLGCRVTGDPLMLITDPAVDAVLIASHDSTHAEFVRACVRASKPVLCEKPLSPTLAEAAAVIRDIGDHPELVSLGFMRRFDPGYVALKSSIMAGAIGLPVLLHSTGRGVSGGPGRTNENSITNSAIHDLDIVPWLLGSPVVEASWHAPRSSAAADGYQDPQLILLRTADGVLSTVDIFLNARYGYDVRCEVIGEAGTASLAEPARIVTDSQLSRRTAYAADWRPRFAEAYRLELQAWIDVVNGGDRGALATARDGLMASAVAEAVIGSMHHGGLPTRVEIPGD